MTGSFLSAIAEHAFEISSLLISTVALVYAALALKAARQAVQLAKESDMVALRLKGQDEVAAAERSFHRLQEACHLNRGQWERHIAKHYPVLRCDCGQAKETKLIAEVENAGRQLLRELKDATPIVADGNAADLESFVKRAQAVAVRIERLAFELELPSAFER